MTVDLLAAITKRYTDNTTDVVELSQAQFIGYMAIGIPSWILYISVIVVLLKASNYAIFGNSYYKLVSVIGLSVGLVTPFLT